MTNLLEKLDLTNKHPVIALFLAPFWGLAFLMFLPFIGFYLTAEALIVRAAKAFRMPAPAIIGAAHMTGHGNDGGEDRSLDKLHDEIKSKR
jgi:uncharacterized iron-regulated membrane protein